MTITRIHLTDTCHRLAHEAVRISRLPVSDPAEIRNAAADALRDLAAHFVATRRALLDVMSAAGAHVETWCEDVDLQGVSLHVFAGEVFEESFYGLAGILVGYRRRPSPSTRRPRRRRSTRRSIPTKALLPAPPRLPAQAQTFDLPSGQRIGFGRVDVPREGVSE